MDEHINAPITIFDDSGRPAGKKPRREIDKGLDIVHAVHILVIHDGQVALGELIEAPINKYGGRFSTTAAGMLREHETVEAAAQRTILRELGLVVYQSIQYGTEMVHLEDGTKRVISFFTIDTEEPLENRDGTVERYVYMSKKDLTTLIVDRQLFSPAFLWIWERYGELLPL